MSLAIHYKVILYPQMNLFKDERFHLNLHEEINKTVYTEHGQMITAGQIIAYEKFISRMSFIFSFLLRRKSKKGLWIFINDSLLITDQWTVCKYTLQIAHFNCYLGLYLDITFPWEAEVWTFGLLIFNHGRIMHIKC